jgi:hypothetical protein
MGTTSFRPDQRAEAVDLTEIHRAMEGVLRQKPGFFCPDQRERMAILDLHSKFYVAVRAILAACDRTEHRQMANTAALKRRFLRRKPRPDCKRAIR